ncbi:MAG: ATP-dependent DNA ligase [archaeon]|nr:ATP-dependent DNA ligase [archaeon]
MQFSELAEYFHKIESVSSRLEMMAILSEMLKKSGKDVKKTIYISQGILGPGHEALEAGIGEGLLEAGIAKASGYPKDEVKKLYKQLGDLGEVAQKLSKNKKQQSLFSEKLSVQKVFGNFVKMAATEGRGSQETKLGAFSELLNSASPLEAKYIARIPLGNMRLGVGDPTIMDALALNYVDEFTRSKKIRAQIESAMKEKKDEKRKEEFARKARQLLREKIEAKYNIHSDLGEIAERLAEKGLAGLEEISMKPGSPIRPTLAERLPSAEQIIEKLGKCIVEAKYDGFRVQVHKKGNDVAIYSRQSENVTHMFPDLVDAVRERVRAKDAIIEGEALAYNSVTQQPLPFQVTIQRKRKYNVEKMAEEFPLRLFVFDVMYLDGKNTMNLPFIERRKKLEGAISQNEKIALTDAIETNDPKKLEEFFLASIENGLEGIIAKDPAAPYIAGARKYAWIKLKRSYKGELNDSVDLAIIGYYKGRGKRTKFGLGGLLCAAYNEQEDSFQSITKIGTGMSEQILAELEEKLSATSEKEKPARVDSGLSPDIWVKPFYVIEVVADEITRSPTHTAGKTGGQGYALRFPRMIKFREKKPEEATTVAEIEQMYRNQKSVALEEKP